VLLAPLAFEAFAATFATPATIAPSPPPIVFVQEVTPTITEAVVPATQADYVMALLSTIATPLLSAGVAATSAPTVLPYSSATLVASPSVVLATVASSSLSSRLHILLDHLYTSSDADSLWGAT